jgi:trimeric autotransporter adhesin
MNFEPGLPFGRVRHLTLVSLLALWCSVVLLLGAAQAQPLLLTPAATCSQPNGTVFPSLVTCEITFTRVSDGQIEKNSSTIGNITIARERSATGTLVNFTSSNFNSTTGVLKVTYAGTDANSAHRAGTFGLSFEISTYWSNFIQLSNYRIENMFTVTKTSPVMTITNNFPVLKIGEAHRSFLATISGGYASSNMPNFAYWSVAYINSSGVRYSGEEHFSQNAKNWTFPTNLPAGTWTIEVKYNGNELNNPVTKTATFTVQKYDSEVGLFSNRSATSSVFNVGENAVLTTRLYSGIGTPSDFAGPMGNITVKLGSKVLGSGVANANGTYDLHTESLSFERLGVARPAAGQLAHIILNAEYAGNDMYNPSSGVGFIYLRSAAGTATAQLTPSATSVAAGGAFTISALVTSSFQTFLPTGTVTFEDMTSGSPVAIGSAIALNSSGRATGSVTAPALGGIASYRLSYSGDADHPAMVSPVVQVTILPPAATTTLAVSNAAPAYGTPVTLTATVTGSAPSGTVTFKDGATTLGTATLSGGAAPGRPGGSGARAAAPAATSRTAALTVSTLTGGAHSITAVYAGDANNGGSTSSAVTVTVAKSATTTALQSSSPGGAYGTSVTFTATVTGATPTGTVTFRDGAATIGTGTIASGVASFATSALAVGQRSITAVYSGDVNNVTSTSTATTVTMTQATSTIALQASTTSPTFGASVTFTATLTPSGATGNVTFKDGTATLGTGALANGVATFTTTALATGARSITAVFGGDANATAATSAAVSVTVGKATPTVALASSMPNATAGASVTFTATLTPATATGTVTFKDGATTIGAPVTIANGVASLSTAALGVGSYSVTAVYSGDANFNTNTSSAVAQVIATTTSGVALSASSTAPAYGANVTFTATVSGFSPTGTVTFTDTTTSQTLGTVAMSTGIATFSTSTLASGPHAVVATYGGDANNGASTSVAVTVTVAPATSSVTLTSTSTSPGLGAAVTFTATVTGVTPTGTVMFRDGGVVIGTGTIASGVATFTTTGLALGSRTITASYSGDPKNGPSTSAALALTVLQNTGAIVLTSSDTGPAIGATITLTATLTTSGVAPTGTVAFKDGATVVGTSAVSAGKATLATSALALGARSLTASYSGDSNYAAVTSAALTVTVKPPTPQVSSAPINVAHGSGGPIDLSQIVSGGATCVEIVRPPVNGTATVTCSAAAAGAARASAARANAAAPPGSIVVNYRPRPGYSGPDSFAIVATGPGGRSNAANVALVVAARPNPSANPDVAGLVNAQVSTVRRLAQAQVTNVSGRLEQLHDENLPETSMGVGFSAPDPMTEQERFRLAMDPGLQSTKEFKDSMFRLNKDLDKTFGKTGAQAQSGRRGPTDWAIWSSGNISLGKENNQGGTTSRFTSEGVTIGIDKRMAEGLRVGFAIGFGADRTRLGTSGTTNSGYNISGTAYASYRIMPQTFLDGLLGFGQASLSSRRYDPTGGVYILGKRTGQEFHGAVSLTYEAKWGKLKVAPYVRLEMLHLALGAYSEEGGGPAALRFGSLSSTSYSGVAGIRTSYPFAMSWGTLTMLARLEYRQTSEGGYRQTFGYADGLDPTSYSIANKSNGSGQLTMGLGTKFDFLNAGILDFEYQFSTTTADTSNSAHTFRGRYKYSF